MCGMFELCVDCLYAGCGNPLNCGFFFAEFRTPMPYMLVSERTQTLAHAYTNSLTIRGYMIAVRSGCAN